MQKNIRRVKRGVRQPVTRAQVAKKAAEVLQTFVRKVCVQSRCLLLQYVLFADRRCSFCLCGCRRCCCRLPAY